MVMRPVRYSVRVHTNVNDSFRDVTASTSPIQIPGLRVDFVARPLHTATTITKKTVGGPSGPQCPRDGRSPMRRVMAAAAIAGAVLLSVSLAGQTASRPAAPRSAVGGRTPDGHPDFQGVY